MQSLRSFSSKETVTLPSVSEEVTWTHACVHNARLLRILCYAPRRTQLLAWSVQSVLTNQDSCFHLVDYGQLLPQYHPLLKQCWVGEVWASASAERNMNLSAFQSQIQMLPPHPELHSPHTSPLVNRKSCGDKYVCSHIHLSARLKSYFAMRDQAPDISFENRLTVQVIQEYNRRA